MQKEQTQEGDGSRNSGVERELPGTSGLRSKSPTLTVQTWG